VIDLFPDDFTEQKLCGTTRPPFPKSVSDSFVRILSEWKYAVQEAFLTPDKPAKFKVPVGVVAATDTELTEEDLWAAFYHFAHSTRPSLARYRATKFRDEMHLDLPFRMELGLGKETIKAGLRVSAEFSLGRLVMNIRIQPAEVLNLSALGVPEDFFSSFNAYSDGIWFITGVLGTGKTTTAASTIKEYVKKHGASAKVTTLEEPNEYSLATLDGVITQREVGVDVRSYEDGMHQALRSASKVVFIAEVRSQEAALAVCRAANAGLKVLLTMHASSTDKCIEAFLNLFTDDTLKATARTTLASKFRTILTQRLLTTERSRRAQERGRAEWVLSTEMIKTNPVLAHGIDMIGSRDEQDRLVRVSNVFDNAFASRANQKSTSHRLEESLARLLQEGWIDEETAILACNNPVEMNKLKAAMART
jgi:Tfp pilus assembly pilus retraction ATPase PilT